ncbi:MAG: MBL fold metallo-hydrolase [Vicinamibacteria bacterium]
MTRSLRFAQSRHGAPPALLGLRLSAALIVVLAAVSAAAAGAAERLPSIPIAPQLAQPQAPGLSLWWTGNAGWLLRAPEVLLGVDLVLEPDEPFLAEFSMDVRYERPLRAADLTKLDLSLVSHAHGDHFARRTTEVLLRVSRCRFLLPRSCLTVADELGIPEARRILAVPGEEIRLPGVTILPVHAIHGDRFGAVYDEANLDDAGYLIETAGRRVFHPGDSVLQQRQLALQGVDVLLVSISEHNTWSENSARLIEALRPRLALPMHYDTYTKEIFWTLGFPDDVRARLSPELRERFRPVRQGERVDLPPTR